MSLAALRWCRGQPTRAPEPANAERGRRWQDRGISRPRVGGSYSSWTSSTRTRPTGRTRTVETSNCRRLMPSATHQGTW